ncbi:MAG: FAD-dependent oxidoreductase [Candidatus Pacebacteria bacterium]|nr:FAD-dependent oxidoreductase [Candidatus Paceibacterota bacterium]MDD4897314.1 FAD-dependent oxidoreductase [Candidatus Paceibacterota bacterium]MDD5445766.1 FAD-dependent oxidoreductase [Candidatus Paceibacterota bacterium]
MTYDLIIIGGGPAGITAGIYAGRQRMKTLLITKEFGGQIAKKAVKIENWPGIPEITGLELVENFISHLRKQDIEIKLTKVANIEKEGDNFIVHTAEKERFLSKTVIISTGADPRPLEVPGEKEFIGKGVSYCVTCDGPLFKNKQIAVIGGGNAGLEAALFMENYASKIYVLEFKEELNADEKNKNEAEKSEKIEIIKNASVKEIKGNDFVEKIIYEDLKTKEEKELSLQGVFIEIGNLPATSFVKNLVDFNERDEIIIECETLKTKTPGLFSAGDVKAGGYKQIVTAAGEGCKAVLSAYKYLREFKNEKN